MKYLYRISLTFMILTIASAAGLFFYYQYQQRKAAQREKTEPVKETAVSDIMTDCDTEYIILRQNMDSGESETEVTDIPAKYIGKKKEELSVLLLEEERAPSLSEREMGLVGVRLSAFSPERVVVVKTYETARGKKAAADGKRDAGALSDRLKNPALSENSGGEDAFAGNREESGQADPDGSRAFYLMARDGMVCVYQEDMKTLYMATNIPLSGLPYQAAQEILDKKYMKSEEELYNFLESYSS